MIFALTPMFASGALRFAFEKATTEGKLTICALLIVSVFSWSVIITKSRQLIKARKMTKKFFTAYKETRDPLELARKGEQFDGAPAYDLYSIGASEVEYHLKNNPVVVARVQSVAPTSPGASAAHTDVLARAITTKISGGSMDTVRVALETAASKAALSLEKGMIVLSTAVAGGPFIGLLGTVWGVMETFSGIARANSASLTAMAPGVAGALIATVVGLFVAIPAMFAYNYMVTTIRALTQELDAFASEFATGLEHKYVDNRSVADELRDSLQSIFSRATQSKLPTPELSSAE